MKLSIAWIFDHIDADWKQCDIPNLIAQLGSKTAEIEAYHTLNGMTQKNNLFVVEITAIEEEMIVVYCAELKKTIDLPLRDHARNGSFYLVQITHPGVRWASSADLADQSTGGDKLLPPLRFEESFTDGSWKEMLVDDWIIDVDNKSITHRPDLWSHRGFAREVAVILDKQLKPLEQYLSDKKVVEEKAQVTVADFTIRNDAPTICKQFCAISIPKITYTPSLLWMARRLALVGSRAINAIVDGTNYVMLDMGQPLHAFDAAIVNTKTLVPRMAIAQEKLALLDGETVELSSHDLVITNGNTPLALAGIMGGLASGVSQSTVGIIVEAATFDPTAIRLTSLKHKKRTESSARFEKTLDPHQPPLALRRFVKLMDDAQIPMDASDTILSVGTPIKPTQITITHEFIEKKLGIRLSTQKIQDTLIALGFGVSCTNDIYEIVVPSIRATKDIGIPEDIVEEIGRLIGYNTITPALPLRLAAPVNTKEIHRIRAIKTYCAYSLAMQEICGYALHDENFLRTIAWEPRDAIEIKNPISEHWRRLATTLAPNLFAAIVQNSADHDHMRFFEWGRIWHKEGDNTTEKKSLAGIFFNKKQPVDFYQSKALLTTLLEELSIDATWHQSVLPLEEWYTPYQTATISHQGKTIGIAGIVISSFSQKHLDNGSAFLFEIDGDFLLAHTPPLKKYIPSSKYPCVVRDISMLVSLTTTVDHLTALIIPIDATIQSVTLVDFFENAAWEGKRAVTFRIALQKSDKTLTKEEIDAIMASVLQALEKTGAIIR